MRHVFSAASAVLALALISFSSSAQESVGLDTAPEVGIKGKIKDVAQGGTGIEGAAIDWAHSSGTTGSVSSDANGDFTITGLEPGTYTLNVTKDGFKDRTGLPQTVIDGQMTIVEVKMRERTTLIVFARRFGWVGIPLLLCSIAMVTFIIERIFTYAKLNKGTDELAARIQEALETGDINGALQACTDVNTPIANVLASGLRRHSDGLAQGSAASKAEIQEMMQESAARELPEFENNLTWLSMIAVVSPLFGLLGTVLGMIRAFTVISLEGTNDPNQLADGISIALYTTAAGLSIAAPALVCYAIFENIVNKNTLRIEDAASSLVNHLSGGGSGAASLPDEG